MFITLEGPEGGGKTTQAKRLTEWLHASGKNVLSVREPGGTDISNKIRSILLDAKSTNMDIRAELLLFCASRAQLVSECIRPHLKKGGIVISDRYADSTLAYQGYARGLDIQVLRTLIDFATYGLTPDITLLLDVDVNAGLARKVANEEWNRLDAEEIQFHVRVREGYRALSVREPNRWVIIDAALPGDVVEEEIKRVVGKAIEREECA